MISADIYSEYEEGLFDVIAHIFLPRELIVFIWSALNSSNFISIVASISGLDALILILTLFLTQILSNSSSKDMVSEEILLSCSMLLMKNG